MVCTIDAEEEKTLNIFKPLWIKDS